MLAMDVNDNAGNLTPIVVWEYIADKSAPTGAVLPQGRISNAVLASRSPFTRTCTACRPA
jgi:hypothetical protein